MKILTFSTLYPNRERPGHGIFVETRLRHLVMSGKIEARVMAPVPWFPFAHDRFGQYASHARAPRNEIRDGIAVDHPRYPVLPKIGMNVAPQLLAKAVMPAIRKLIDAGQDFDLIDAHYFYPDGVAAVMLAKHFNKPVVVTARGSDITLFPHYPRPRKLILQAASEADGVITVCQALKDEMVRLGVPAQRITTLRNGVDLDLFAPVEREPVRRRLGIEGFTLLSVGNLIPLKGHDLVIDALQQLPGVRLLIAGKGPERGALEARAKALQVADRVRFLGTLPQAELRHYYGAADALVLASSREGWANVLLEAMACGTPVVASRVWGTPEVVASPDAGLLMETRSAAGVAQAVRQLQRHYPDRGMTRRYAEGFSWDDTTAGQLRLFTDILRRRSGQRTLAEAA
ncbi:glycosyltransferase family 4 protein [Noviherbaspirillum sp.]|uniref:glycosyltransferase family 4 protein n=1 Tax=Noviherbaspirillum sp. TaxID=1926288 RepID=UPI002D4273BB|nr:glycosyltransferase family 4 protein [Noviherbaspirillum sp.]HZW21701.1 glycosyltransferase family 4 protein [Noviherbaspirillum sp.]